MINLNFLNINLSKNVFGEKNKFNKTIKRFIESFMESEYFAVKLKNLMPGFVGFIDSKFIVKEARRLRKDIRENKKEIIKTIEEFIDLRNK
jgi:hypothetical protein